MLYGNLLGLHQMVFALSGENPLWSTTEDKRNLVFIAIIFFLYILIPIKTNNKKCQIF